VTAPLTAEQERELRELVIKLRPAPWRAQKLPHDTLLLSAEPDLQEQVISEGHRIGEAEQIATMRNALPDLLAALDAAEERARSYGPMLQSAIAHGDELRARVTELEAENRALKARLEAVRTDVETALSKRRGLGETLYHELSGCTPSALRHLQRLVRDVSGVCCTCVASLADDGLTWVYPKECPDCGGSGRRKP
jgi:hypothetical protein